MNSGVAETVAAVRERAPLVHCLTATVTMNLVADALLAAGARPMMTETRAEAPVMTALADALLINLGTLSTDGAEGMPPTVAAARAKGSPWVLDPTAVGVAPLRTELAGRLLAHRPAVIRGNASEVLALAGEAAGGRGTDATHSTGQAMAAARALARRTGGVVAVSGAVDTITDGERTQQVHNGHPMLTRVTGTGCSLGALVAACCAVTDPFTAALTATVWLGVAGEQAAGIALGAGSFKTALLDRLTLLEPDEIAAKGRIA